MLKRILVPLDTSAYTEAATRMAAHIATRGAEAGLDAATLVGLGIVDLDQIPTGRFAGVVNRDELIAEAQQTAEKLVADFRERAGSLGIAEANLETRTAQGSPFRMIIRESVFSDLVVMGEKCSYPPVNVDYDTLHNLYHQASRPIVIGDQNFREIKRIVLAMDGTAPSSRMLYQFMHLSAFPQAEVIVAYSREERENYHLQEFFPRVKECLENFNFRVRLLEYEGEFDLTITDVVNDEQADLLALGVHREHFLYRLADPLHIREDFAKRLLKRMTASLLVVN